MPSPLLLMGRSTRSTATTQPSTGGGGSGVTETPPVPVGPVKVHGANSFKAWDGQVFETENIRDGDSSTGAHFQGIANWQYLDVVIPGPITHICTTAQNFGSVVAVTLKAGGTWLSKDLRGAFASLATKEWARAVPAGGSVTLRFNRGTGKGIFSVYEVWGENRA